MNAKETLVHRLRALNYEGPLDTADECRTGVIACLATEAVCARFDTGKGRKLLTFRAAWELVFGQAWETRERKERAARKADADAKKLCRKFDDEDKALARDVIRRAGE